MKRAALYMRVSTLDQHPETQLHDLRQMAVQRGYEIVNEYTDRISGVKARRPGLDELMRDARRGTATLLLTGIVGEIIRSGRVNQEFVRDHAVGVEQVIKAAEKTDLLEIASITGVAPEKIREIASLGGDLSNLIPQNVQKRLEGRFSKLSRRHSAPGAEG